MAEAIDFSPWERGSGFVIYPKLDLDSVGLSFEKPIPEQKNRRGAVTQRGRPVAVRLTGPTAGVRVWTDPERLRSEARRLLDAADLLAELQEATATTLFGEAS